MMTLLPFPGDGRAALPATHEAEIGQRRFLLMGPTTPGHHILNLVEKLLGNDRLMRPFMRFPNEPEKPDVKIIRKQFGQHAPGNGLFLVAAQIPGRDHPMQVVEGMASRGIGFKHPAHQLGLVFVHNDRAQPGFIQITDRRLAGKFPATAFLPLAAPDILGKIVDVIFRLPEGDGQHELSLRRIVEPERGEFQGTELVTIELVNNATTIDGIPGQPVGMPGQKTRCGTFLHFGKHLVKHRTPRLLGRLRFDELLGNGKTFLGGIFPKLIKLGLD